MIVYDRSIQEMFLMDRREILICAVNNKLIIYVEIFFSSAQTIVVNRYKLKIKPFLLENI